MTMSFCEPVHVTGPDPWCVRILTDAGLKFGGGVDTESLCGRVRKGQGWDVKVKFDAEHEHMCSRCREKLGENVC